MRFRYPFRYIDRRDVIIYIISVALSHTSPFLDTLEDYLFA